MSKSEIEEAFNLAQAVFAAGLLARTLTAMQALQDTAAQPEHDGAVTIPAVAWQAFADERASVLRQIQLQGLQDPNLPH